MCFFLLLLVSGLTVDCLLVVLVVHVWLEAVCMPAHCFQLGQLYSILFFSLETDKLLNKKELKAVRTVCVEHKLTMKGLCFTG